MIEHEVIGDTGSARTALAVAADAKILEERFKARLSAIGDSSMTSPLRDLH
jgi:hypothetical protein